MKAIVAGALVLAAATAAPAERGLEIYWVDVEGGGATLIVTPARGRQGPGSWYTAPRA